MQNNKEILFVLHPISNPIFSLIRWTEKCTIILVCITLPIVFSFFFIQIPQLAFVPSISGILLGLSFTMFALVGVLGEIISWKKPLVVKFQENGVGLLTKDQTSLVFHIPSNEITKITAWKTFSLGKAVYFTFHYVNGQTRSFLYKYNDLMHVGKISIVERFELFRIQLEKVGFDVNGIEQHIHRTQKMGKIIFAYVIIIVVVSTIISKFL